MPGHRSPKGVVLFFQALPNDKEPNAPITSGVELALALRGMGSVTVLNYMPTDPIVDAVGCLSRGGNFRHGGRLPLNCRAARETSREPLTLELKLLTRGR